MSEQWEWVFWQVLSDTMRLILISIWLVGAALVFKGARGFWRGFREWERINYGDK